LSYNKQALNSRPDIHCYITVKLEEFSSDREVGSYRRAVSEQQLGKHVPAATDTNAAMVQQQRNCFLWYAPAAVATQLRDKRISAATNSDTIEELFSLWSVPRCYKQGTRSEVSQFCMGVCEERT
jgi:hypothetical protein